MLSKSRCSDVKFSQSGLGLSQMVKSGTFSDKISEHFGSVKSDLKKSRICRIMDKSETL